MRRLTPPPRHVPLSLRFASHGNTTAQAGWIVFVIGSLLFAFVAPRIDYSVFPRELVPALGHVTKVEWPCKTVTRQQVVAHHYEFSAAGRPYRGVAYATATTVAVGDRVTVLYEPADPWTSSVTGMRSNEFPLSYLFAVIFPLVGLPLMRSGFAAGRRRNHLLRHGVLANGVLKDSGLVPSERGDGAPFPEWELRFEFTAQNGRNYQTTARAIDPERLADDSQEPVLYDPQNPLQALVLAEAPSMMLHTRPTARIGSRGELMGDPAVFVHLIVLMMAVGFIWLFGTLFDVF